MEYREGAKNGIADALSKWLLRPSEEDENIIDKEKEEEEIDSDVVINNVVLQEVD